MKKVWSIIGLVLLVLIIIVVGIFAWRYTTLMDLKKKYSQFEKSKNVKCVEKFYGPEVNGNYKLSYFLDENSKIVYNVNGLEIVNVDMNGLEDGYIFFPEGKKYIKQDALDIEKESPQFKLYSDMFLSGQSFWDDALLAMKTSIRVFDAKKNYIQLERFDFDKGDKYIVDSKTGLPVEVISKAGDLMKSFECEFGVVTPDDLKVDTEGYTQLKEE